MASYEYLIEYQRNGVPAVPETGLTNTSTNASQNQPPFSPQAGLTLSQLPATDGAYPPPTSTRDPVRILGEEVNICKDGLPPKQVRIIPSVVMVALINDRPCFAYFTNTSTYSFISKSAAKDYGLSVHATPEHDKKSIRSPTGYYEPQELATFSLKLPPSLGVCEQKEFSAHILDWDSSAVHLIIGRGLLIENPGLRDLFLDGLNKHAPNWRVPSVKRRNRHLEPPPTLPSPTRDTDPATTTSTFNNPANGYYHNTQLPAAPRQLISPFWPQVAPHPASYIQPSSMSSPVSVFLATMPAQMDNNLPGSNDYADFSLNYHDTNVMNNLNNNSRLSYGQILPLNNVDYTTNGGQFLSQGRFLDGGNPYPDVSPTSTGVAVGNSSSASDYPLTPLQMMMESPEWKWQYL